MTETDGAADGLGSPGRSALAADRRRRSEELAGWTRTLVRRVTLVAAVGLTVQVLANQARSPWAELLGLAVAALVGWRLRFRPSEQVTAWRRGAARGAGARRTAARCRPAPSASRRRRAGQWPVRNAARGRRRRPGPSTGRQCQQVRGLDRLDQAGEATSGSAARSSWWSWAAASTNSGAFWSTIPRWTEPSASSMGRKCSSASWTGRRPPPAGRAPGRRRPARR
jgi:hypothetical protein